MEEEKNILPEEKTEEKTEKSLLTHFKGNWRNVLHAIFSVSMIKLYSRIFLLKVSENGTVLI